MNYYFGLIEALVAIIKRAETDYANPADLYYAYRLLLDRRPDDTGWAEWLGLIRLGYTRAALVDSFMNSAEYQAVAVDKPPVRLELEHGVMYVDPNDYFISNAIIHEGEYEPNVTAVFKRVLTPESIFVDIGANMGWFTLLSASVAKQGKVIAIEPNMGNVQLLYQSLLANKMENVIVYPYAVTATESILELSAVHSNGIVSTPGEVADEGHVFVRGVALDDLLSGEPRIDLIKIDIEGHEPIALEGMRQILQRHRPILISEFHPKFIRHTAGREPEAYLADLIALGYDLAVIDAEGREIQGSPDIIMEQWRKTNQQYDVKDLVHVDLIARPT